MRLIIRLTIVLTAISSFNAYAEDLMEIYNIAKAKDAILHAAYHQHKSELEAIPKAMAAFLPSLTTSGYVKANDSTDPTISRHNTWGYQLAISQPILRFSDWSELAQAKSKVKAAIATLANTEQDLLLRVATQYFAILKADNDWEFARAERKAFTRYLEQTQQKFKVGLSAITDVHEATARKDNAYSLEITAENNFESEKEQLREIIGEPIFSIVPLKNSPKLPTPNPRNIEQWVQAALDQNLELQAARHNLELTKEFIVKEKANHLPTITLDANVIRSKAAPLNPIKATTKDVGLNIVVPIFAGGSTLAKTRSAKENHEQALELLENKTREVESTARQYYRNVFNKISKVEALKQSVTSSQSALNATRVAFNVGTRTIVDVLNAESDLLNAERNYSKSHYDYILESLKLKQVAGILKPSDLEEINNWLKPTSTKRSQVKTKTTKQAEIKKETKKLEQAKSKKITQKTIPSPLPQKKAEHKTTIAKLPAKSKVNNNLISANTTAVTTNNLPTLTANQTNKLVSTNNKLPSLPKIKAKTNAFVNADPNLMFHNVAQLPNTIAIKTTSKLTKAPTTPNTSSYSKQKDLIAQTIENYNKAKPAKIIAIDPADNSLAAVEVDLSSDFN